MPYLCPVCFFDQMPYPPRDYDICPCCGTEFGNDDVEYSLEELRNAWVADGAQWFYGQPPADWNPWLQLIDGGRPDLVPESLYNWTFDFNESNSIWGSPSYENTVPFSMIGQH
jgi:hypothetical protein